MPAVGCGEDLEAIQHRLDSIYELLGWRPGDDLPPLDPQPPPIGAR